MKKIITSLILHFCSLLFFSGASLTVIAGGVAPALVQRTANSNFSLRNLSSWADFSNRKAVFIGDSIVFGANASPLPQSAYATIVSANNNWIVINMGISGQCVYNDGVHSPVFDPTTIPVWNDSYGVMFFDLGINDFGFGTSAANFQSALDNAIGYAINTRGWPPNRIMLMALYWVPSDISAYTTACLTVAQNKHTMYADMKALIITQCLPSDPATVYISGDNKHPNQNGQTVIIPGVIQNLNLTPL